VFGFLSLNKYPPPFDDCPQTVKIMLWISLEELLLFFCFSLNDIPQKREAYIVVISPIIARKEKVKGREKLEFN